MKTLRMKMLKSKQAREGLHAHQTKENNNNNSTGKTGCTNQTTKKKKNERKKTTATNWITLHKNLSLGNIATTKIGHAASCI